MNFNSVPLQNITNSSLLLTLKKIHKMDKVEGKDGTNQSRGSNGKNTNSEVFYPNHKDCFHCNQLINVRLQEKVENFEKLPASENKLVEMKAFRLETDLRLSVFKQDHLGIMDKMIAHEKELLEIENEKKEKKRLIKEAVIRANEIKNCTIQAGVTKLVVDCEECELAAFFKRFVLESTNKKHDHIFKDTNKILATWICNSISLKNDHVVTYNTIVNGLSRIDNVDPNDEKAKK